MILKILLLILLIPIIILSIVLIMNILPLPASIDGIRDQIAAGFFSLIYLTWIFFYTVYSFRRAGRILDDVCLASGLEFTDPGGLSA
ncbi:MAG: hypothetical protein E3J58_07135 [Actinomycetota bacterium]|nr:MAG: hypothetical protein E3J58_07135 [Actinomycetota bacterium]